MKNGCGFIKYPPNNLFFHASDMLNADFQDLREGDPVEFSLGLNRDGDEVAKRVKLIFDDAEDAEDAS
jgi:cold shock CspA family protein